MISSSYEIAFVYEFVSFYPMNFLGSGMVGFYFGLTCICLRGFMLVFCRSKALRFEGV